MVDNATGLPSRSSTFPLGTGERSTPDLCANRHGFNLHATVRCGARQRKALERLCRYITRPAIANERLTLNRAGEVVLTLKSSYRDGTTHDVAAGIHAAPGRQPTA